MAKAKGSGWGGKRPGAGRPRKYEFLVHHNKRPRVDPDHPLLVTKRVLDDVDLDDAQTWAVVRESVAELADSTPGFEVQRLTREGSALLFLVSAKSKKALTQGMQGLSIMIAHRLNRLYERTGKVFAARYEAEALDSKKAVERALARF